MKRKERKRKPRNKNLFFFFFFFGTRKLFGNEKKQKKGKDLKFKVIRERSWRRKEANLKTKTTTRLQEESVKCRQDFLVG